MTQGQTLSRIKELAVIATIRAPSAEAAVDTCEALLAGGVECLEITFTTPEAPAAIAAARARFGDRALVGAGTLRDEAEARAAIDAYAEFLVSPGLEPGAAAAMAAAPVPALIGALTPTEAMRAAAAGADAVKLFPSSLGGVPYLKALRGPLPDIPIVPTGGIGPQQVTEFLEAGAFAVGAGGELCPKQAIAEGDFATITELAKQFKAAVPAR